MNIRKFCTIGLSIVLAVGILFTGCVKKTAQIAPFSDATWELTESDLSTVESGEEKETYPSMYYGQTHTFDKSYLEYDGTVKYMFDDKGQLMGLAWTVVAKSEAQYQEIYKTLKDKLKKEYGDSTDRSGQTNAGDVWYTEDGDIVLIGSSTDKLKVIQCGYLNPAVSGEDNTSYIRTSEASEAAEGSSETSK